MAKNAPVLAFVTWRRGKELIIIAMKKKKKCGFQLLFVAQKHVLKLPIGLILVEINLWPSKLLSITASGAFV